MGLWNPFAQKFDGTVITGQVPCKVVVEGRVATKVQLAMAQNAYSLFSSSSRLSTFKNTAARGVLSDGSLFSIQRMGAMSIMKLHPAGKNDKPVEPVYGILLESGNKQYLISNCGSPGEPINEWKITRVYGWYTSRNGINKEFIDGSFYDPELDLYAIVWGYYMRYGRRIALINSGEHFLGFVSNEEGYRSLVVDLKKNSSGQELCLAISDEYWKKLKPYPFSKKISNNDTDKAFNHTKLQTICSIDNEANFEIIAVSKDGKKISVLTFYYGEELEPSGTSRYVELPIQVQDTVYGPYEGGSPGNYSAYWNWRRENEYIIKYTSVGNYELTEYERDGDTINLKSKTSYPEGLYREPKTRFKVYSDFEATTQDDDHFFIRTGPQIQKDLVEVVDDPAKPWEVRLVSFTAQGSGPVSYTEWFDYKNEYISSISYGPNNELLIVKLEEIENYKAESNGNYELYNHYDYGTGVETGYSNENVKQKIVRDKQVVYIFPNGRRFVSVQELFVENVTADRNTLIHPVGTTGDNVSTSQEKATSTYTVTANYKRLLIQDHGLNFIAYLDYGLEFTRSFDSEYIGRYRSADWAWVVDAYDALPENARMSGGGAIPDVPELRLILELNGLKKIIKVKLPDDLDAVKKEIWAVVHKPVGFDSESWDKNDAIHGDLLEARYRICAALCRAATVVTVDNVHATGFNDSGRVEPKTGLHAGKNIRGKIHLPGVLWNIFGSLMPSYTKEPKTGAGYLYLPGGSFLREGGLEEPMGFLITKDEIKNLKEVFPDYTGAIVEGVQV